MKGEVYCELKMYGKAIKIFENLLRKDKSHAVSWTNLGSIYWTLGRLKLAEAHYRQAIRLNPRRASVLNYLGRLLVERGRIEQACPLLRKAIRLDFSQAVTTRGKFLSMGSKFSNRNQHTKAFRFYQAACRTIPTDPRLHMELGRCLIFLKQYKKGIFHLRRAVQIYPGYQNGWSMLGRGYYCAGDLKNGFAFSELALKMDKGDKRALETISMIGW